MGAGFNWSAAPAGDVNGDGYWDVVGSLAYYDLDQPSTPGIAFLFSGSPAGLSISPWSVKGNQAEAVFLGRSVSSAGDVNGDGYSDVIIGSDGTFNSGKALLYLGSPSGLLPEPAWTAEGAEASFFSLYLGSAGDVNGDGYSDVIVGAPGGTYDGKAFLYLGSSTGLSRSPAWSMELPYSRSGASAGDVNGDGYSDVVIGEPYYGNGAGRVFVYLGSESGLSPSPAWVMVGSQAHSQFGSSVASVGDVNGDGFSDLIVMAPQYSDAQVGEGRASLYLGSKSGLSLAPAWMIGGHQENVRLGSVSPAGDVNGDGYSDVIVSAQEPNIINHGFFGWAFLYLGSPSGLSSSPAWKARGLAPTWVATAGDMNGDGYADLLVGEYEADYQSFLVHQYLGNHGGKLRRSARQVRLGDGEPLALMGRSGAPDAFRLKASVTPPKGGHVGHLEWEVRSVPGRSQQDEVTTGRGADQDLSGALAEFDETIEVPGPGYFHWRVRIHTDDPLEPNSPWFSMSGNGMTETKVRVGDPPSPPMAPIGLGPKDLIYTDTPPMPFSWHSGEGSDQFELEWSSNPEFRDIRVSAGIGAKPKSIGVYVPDPGTWLRILQMGRYPDPRQAPIFWKVSTNKNGVTSQAPTSGFWLAPVQGPRLLAPLDGKTFFGRDPPTLAWDANHNLDTWDLTSHGGFEVWFSTQRSLRNPLVLGSGYAIKSTSWPPTRGWILSDWQRIVEMSCGTTDGRVYYAVFSQDAIGRRAWSQVQSFQIDREPTTCTGVPPSAQASHRQRGSGRKHGPGWKWHSH
jgi:FG-GAP repeat.